MPGFDLQPEIRLDRQGLSAHLKGDYILVMLVQPVPGGSFHNPGYGRGQLFLSADRGKAGFL